ncbi:hypothetical protein [Lichenicoccus sp.]|uniref:hypothetical protein n=1 Tax=Lichenicoccus sp. TaxID=2781899 RepID=UPI003D0B8C1A
MGQLTCLGCEMRFDSALGHCPVCGTRPPSLLRRVWRWRWPLPLAIGLAVEIASTMSRAAGTAAIGSDLARASAFLAATLIFAGLAALLLRGGEFVVETWQRRAGRRRIHRRRGEEAVRSRRRVIARRRG